MVFPRAPRGFVAERRRARYFPAVVRVAPELRDVLHRRLFLTPRSAAFDLAVLGLAAAALARRPSPLLATLPYARAATRGVTPWRRSQVLAAAWGCAADAVTAAQLVRGSLAARTPVL
jgi:hypothetical protein